MPRVFVDRIAVDATSIDMNNHVNNQEYIRWMQDVATAHSTAQGWSLARYFETKLTWVIRSHYIEYIRPAFAGDVLVVATWVAHMETQTCQRKFRFTRAHDGKTVAEAETLWVFCDGATGRSTNITESIRDSFPVVTDKDEIQAAIVAAR